MKTMRFNFAMLMALLLSCNAEKNEVVITGQFEGEHPEEIGYTSPVNGTLFEGFINNVKLDTLGRFQITLDVDRPTLVNFLFFGSPSLIIEPGNSYDLTFNRNKDHNVQIGWNSSEIQEVYSNFPHQHPMSCLYSYDEEFTNYHSIKQKLHGDLAKEISILHELYSQDKVSEEVLNLLLTDRKVYYYTAQSVLSSRNHLHNLSNNEEVPDDIFSIWQEAAHAVPLDSELLLSSYYSFDFLYMHILYKIYTTFDIDEFVALRAEKKANGTTHAHNIELAKMYLSGDVLEFYIAATFHDQLRRRQYDHNTISLLEQFKSDFPNSNYLPFVEKIFEKIEKQKELISLN